jgi:hypothetical protein
MKTVNQLSDPQKRDFREGLQRLSRILLTKEKNKINQNTYTRKRAGKTYNDLNCKLKLVLEEENRRRFELAPLPYTHPIPEDDSVSGLGYLQDESRTGEEDVCSTLAETSPCSVLPAIVLAPTVVESINTTLYEWQQLVEAFDRLQLQDLEDKLETSIEYARSCTHYNKIRNLPSVQMSLPVYASLVSHDLIEDRLFSIRALHNLQSEHNLSKQRLLQDQMVYDLRQVEILGQYREGVLVPPHLLLGPRESTVVYSQHLHLISLQQLQSLYLPFPLQIHELRRSFDIPKLETVIEEVQKHLVNLQELSQWASNLACQHGLAFQDFPQAVISGKFPLEQMMFRQYCLCSLCVQDLTLLKDKLETPLLPGPDLTMYPVPGRRSFWFTHEDEKNFSIQVASIFHNTFLGEESFYQPGLVVDRKVIQDDSNLLTNFKQLVTESCQYYNRRDVTYPLGLDPKLVDLETWIRFLFCYSRVPSTEHQPTVCYANLNEQRTVLKFRFHPGPLDQDEPWVIIRVQGSILLKGLDFANHRELWQNKILLNPQKFFKIPQSTLFLDSQLNESEAAEKLDADFALEAGLERITVEEFSKSKRVTTWKCRIVEVINGREITREATTTSVHEMSHSTTYKLTRRKNEFNQLRERWTKQYADFVDKDHSDQHASGERGFYSHAQKRHVTSGDLKTKSQEATKRLSTSSESSFVNNKSDPKNQLKTDLRSMLLEFKDNIFNCERELRKEELYVLKETIVNFLRWTKDEVRSIALNALGSNDWATALDLATMSDMEIKNGVVQLFPGPLGRITPSASWRSRYKGDLKLVDLISDGGGECAFPGLFNDPKIVFGLGVRRAENKLQDAHKEYRLVSKIMSDALVRLSL